MRARGLEIGITSDEVSEVANIAEKHIEPVPAFGNGVATEISWASDRGTAARLLFDIRFGSRQPRCFSRFARRDTGGVVFFAGIFMLNDLKIGPQRLGRLPSEPLLLWRWEFWEITP